MAQGTPAVYTSQDHAAFVIGQKYIPRKAPTENFTPIPESLGRYRGLSFGAKFVLARLMRFADAAGRAYPAVGTLADESGVSSRQIHAYLQELTVKRFLEIEANAGRQNSYRFLWHEALEGETGELRRPPPQYTAGVISVENRGDHPRSTLRTTPAVHCARRKN